MQRLDIILVGALAGLEAAAIYGAATRFLALGQMVARAVSQSVQPLLGESLARHDYSDTAQLYQASTAWLVLSTWPLYLILLNFGGTVLTVFGDGYSVGDSALLVLCAAMLVATACGMVDMVLIMAGRSFWNLTNVLLALSVNIGLDFLLIPTYGVLGAALGWAAALLIGNVLPLMQVFHWFRLHPFGRATLLAVMASTIPFGAVPIALRALTDGDAHFITSLTLGILTFSGALLLLRKQLQLGVLVSVLRKRRASRKAPVPSA